MLGAALLFALKAVYLFLPAIFANMMPPLFRNVRFLDWPVDFDRKFLGKPIFGSHKTYRGFFFGIIVAIITASFQKWMFLDFAPFAGISIIDYFSQSAVLLGFLMGLGALLGDLVESFIKRRINVKPGKPWIPFDQVDFVIGALLLMMIVYIPSWQVIVFLLIAVPFGHIAVNHIGYYIGINKSKW